MFLDTLVLTRTLPCLAEPGKIIVIGKPNRVLNEVIPYLATLPGVIAYNPETHTLTFRRQPGFMTLYPDKVYITQVKDTEEGLVLLDALKEAVNMVWDKREELIAVMRPKSALRHLDLWALLPQTNCRQCGEATCLAFAVLRRGEIGSLDFLKRSIKKIMDPHPATTEEEGSAAEALRTMVEKNLVALPVMDKKKNLKGVVTLRDLLNLRDRGEAVK